MPPPEYTDLVARLPRSFGPTLNDQFRQWDLLFPAERRLLRRQLGWLAALPAGEFQRLFAPITALESRMELPKWQPGTAGLSIVDTGMIARSPHYPEWRTEVERIFSRVNAASEPASKLARLPRLLICALPPGLPVADQTLWPDLAAQGKWLQLASPFGEMEQALVASLAKRRLSPDLEDIEATWVIECVDRLSQAVAATSAVRFSWDSLAAARRVFLNRLNSVPRDLKSVDQTTDDLRRLDLAPLLGPGLGDRPRVREFIRAVLLSGNGSLVFNNSFVQWGSSEALRRVEPQLLVAGFGIRPKLKPFSSTVLFEDQHRANPAPDQDDPAGSLIDAQMLSQYVYYTAARLAPNRDFTLTLFTCADLPLALALGPQTALARVVSGAGALDSERLAARLLAWLAPA
ncbi:MAG: hypothetical protein P4K98_04315 [Bryobacteraceae bacterium]|nr:hypothetical protein [Bryobacteraceae bacterium]